MPILEIRFQVAGKPVPEGSTRAFPVKGKARAVVVHSNHKELMPWRDRIAYFCREAMLGVEWPKDQAYQIYVEFCFLRPKSHLTKKGNPSSNYRKFHTSRPDLDKLLRAIGDALKGIVFNDDSQVTFWMADKIYDTWEGVKVRIETMR